jgi:hypothetical protein
MTPAQSVPFAIVQMVAPKRLVRAHFPPKEAA